MELESSSTVPLDETETDTTANTQVSNKRRSIVFQRRSLAVSPRDSNETQDESESESKCSEEPQEKEQDQFNLADYIKCLKKEREVWNKTLMERKSKRRRLVKQSTFGPDEMDLDLSVLPALEKNYIQSRPNYQQISNKINNLPNLAVKISILNATIKHLNGKLEEKLNQDIHNYTKKVIRVIANQDGK